MLIEEPSLPFRLSHQRKYTRDAPLRSILALSILYTDMKELVPLLIPYLVKDFTLTSLTY